MNWNSMGKASIYNLSEIRKKKRKDEKKVRQYTNLSKAREVLCMPNATINGIYLKIVKITGIPERKSNAAKHRAIAKYLKRKASPSNRFYESEEWRKLRYKALKKYGRRCVCCGNTPENGAILHVDHIKPRSRYPDLSLDIDNLQIMCADCNLGKSNTDSIDYR